MIKVHASAVAIEGQAILLRGPSGSGKSDLALRLIDEGADLISDDYVELTVCPPHVLARAPTTIRGLMEVRGLGLITVHSIQDVPLSLVCNLMQGHQIDRMPERDTSLFFDGIELPLIPLDGLAVSSPAKIRLYLSKLGERLQTAETTANG